MTLDASRVIVRAGAGRIGREANESRCIVVVLDVTEFTVLDDREVGGLAHGQDRPLGVDGGQQSAVVGDRPTTYCIRSATWLSRSPRAPLPARSFLNHRPVAHRRRRRYLDSSEPQRF